LSDAAHEKTVKPDHGIDGFFGKLNFLVSLYLELHHDAAIDLQHLASHKTTIVRTKIRNHAANIFGVTKPARWVGF
jgi:hypothetical protein